MKREMETAAAVAQFFSVVLAAGSVQPAHYTSSRPAVKLDLTSTRSGRQKKVIQIELAFNWTKEDAGWCQSKERGKEKVKRGGRERKENIEETGRTSRLIMIPPQLHSCLVPRGLLPAQTTRQLAACFLTHTSNCRVARSPQLFFILL